jgi:hypothetical protein
MGILKKSWKQRDRRTVLSRKCPKWGTTMAPRTVRTTRITMHRQNLDRLQRRGNRLARMMTSLWSKIPKTSVLPRGGEVILYVQA